MTAWADIVSAAMVQIDDVRWREQLQTSPALFYRRVSALMEQALPLLSRPPELLLFLKSGMTTPSYADAEWTSTDESVEMETAVETGQTGFALCSVTLRAPQDNSTVIPVPYPGAVYDEETGAVTFPKQTSAGISYDIDFYNDGAFPDLSEVQKRLFALAVAVVWDENFSRSYLNMQMKIKDENFSTVNEATYIEKVTKRLHDNRISFNDELRAYEQLCAYTAAVRNGALRVKLV